ncbi:TPA: hypothetical protein ACXJNB_000489 [Serratia marcescens]
MHNAALLDDALATRVIAARAQLLRDLQALDPRDISAAAPVNHYRLSALYAGLLAIGGCLAWHRAMPQKLPLILTQLMVKRQLAHLQLNADDGLSEAEADQVFDHLRDAYRRQVSFDLMQYPLQGWEN